MKGHRWVDEPTAPAARREARPVEDVQAPAVSPPPAPRPAPGRTGKALPLDARHRSRERRAHLRQDAAGVLCACDDTTPCLAHAGITGRRRCSGPGDHRGPLLLLPVQRLRLRRLRLRGRPPLNDPVTASMPVINEAATSALI